MKNINEAITLACAGIPRWLYSQTNFGKVEKFEPELKFVMMKSSNDNEKASNAAEAMPGMTSGKVIFMNGCRSFA